MKLSSTEIIVGYRERLKTLRSARIAVGADAHGKMTCSTWYHGEQFDFCKLLSVSTLKEDLRVRLDHEIHEVTFAIKAHGVHVDE